MTFYERCKVQQGTERTRAIAGDNQDDDNGGHWIEMMMNTTAIVITAFVSKLHFSFTYI